MVVYALLSLDLVKLNHSTNIMVVKMKIPALTEKLKKEKKKKPQNHLLIKKLVKIMIDRVEVVNFCR